MQASYGTYAHDADEVAPTSFSKRVNHTPDGARSGLLHSVTIRGVKHAADQAALKTALLELEAAYSEDGRDFILLDNSSNESIYTLKNINSTTGVLVKDFRLMSGEGTAEYTTFQTYEIDLEAEYAASSSPQLLTFNETVSYTGGGPERVFLPCLYGPPQEQITRQQTTYRAIQSGSAIGFFAYPGFPGPLFPEYEHLPRRRVDKSRPQNFNAQGQPTNWPIAWSFEFESINPFPFSSPTGV